MQLTYFAATLAAIAGTASASQNISCAPYVPAGWNASSAKANFYNNNPNNDPANGAGFQAPSLPANATINPTTGLFYLASPPSIGQAFNVSACNITSLGLTTNTSQSSCSHNGCYHTYTNYVRLQSPKAGNCLTIQHYNTSASPLDFETCNSNPNNTAQIFVATQTVQYTLGYTNITSISGVDFENMQNFSLGSAFAWSLDRMDNRTVQTIKSAYTQAGLSAALVHP